MVLWMPVRDRLRALRRFAKVNNLMAKGFVIGVLGVTLRRGLAMRLTAAGLVATALSVAPGAAEAEPTLIEQKESIYNSIYIYEDAPYVTMLFGKNRRLYTESRVNRSDPFELPVAYTRYMTVGMAYPDTVSRLLEIGVGGGSTISYLARTYPEIEIDAVELDGAVLAFAREYFFVEENERVRLHEKDGRIFLRRADAGFDVIMIDAYRGPFVPFHLLTREFYALVAEKLAPGGVVLQNVDPSTMLYESAVATIDAVFDTVEVYEAKGNFVIVAYQGEAKSDEALHARAAERDAAFAPRYPLADLVLDRRPASVEEGTVLSDDFAPVEALKATRRHNRPGFPQD
ncbi:MAG: fused MFS/spermidine synthase [Pseudomonadota bacterium]